MAFHEKIFRAGCAIFPGPSISRNARKTVKAQLTESVEFGRTNWDLGGIATMIEARAAQKLGRSVAVARVLPPSLLSLSLTNREDIA